MSVKNAASVRQTAAPNLVRHSSESGDENSNRLPDMDELPESDLVIYDGDCNFCRVQVRRLNWLAGGRLAFVSLHDDRVSVRFPDLSREELMAQLYVVATSGKRLAGATGLRYLSRRLPRLWPVAPFLHIPFSLPVWQMLYRIVARYRYRLAGKSMDCSGDHCRLHID